MLDRKIRWGLIGAVAFVLVMFIYFASTGDLRNTSLPENAVRFSSEQAKYVVNSNAGSDVSLDDFQMSQILYDAADELHDSGQLPAPYSPKNLFAPEIDQVDKDENGHYTVSGKWKDFDGFNSTITRDFTCQVWPIYESGEKNELAVVDFSISDDKVTKPIDSGSSGTTSSDSSSSSSDSSSGDEEESELEAESKRYLEEKYGTSDPDRLEEIFKMYKLQGDLFYDAFGYFPG